MQRLRDIEAGSSLPVGHPLREQHVWVLLQAREQLFYVASHPVQQEARIDADFCHGLRAHTETVVYGREYLYIKELYDQGHQRWDHSAFLLHLEKLNPPARLGDKEDTPPK